MRLRWVAVSRWPGWPRPAVVVVAVWLALVAAGAHLAPDQTLCLFRRVTGLPCAACGTTRGSLALLSGDVVAAFLFNPLFVALLVGFAVATLARLATGRALRVEGLPRPLERLAVLGFVLAVAANWAWVAARVG